jgi:hydrogenase nickel incorporation protein HypA/HybF
MHELSITQNIVSIVAEAAGGHPVKRVTLEVGKLSGVMLDAIVFCFDVVAKGTPVEGATLEIHEIEGRGQCAACGNEFPMPTLFTRCPCGSRRITRVHGEELKVRTMELELS